MASGIFYNFVNEIILILIELFFKIKLHAIEMVSSKRD
jgi:hypothetical protein